MVCAAMMTEIMQGFSAQSALFCVTLMQPISPRTSRRLEVWRFTPLR
jgi:hypothetical protein